MYFLILFFVVLIIKHKSWQFRRCQLVCQLPAGALELSLYLYLHGEADARAFFVDLFMLARGATLFDFPFFLHCRIIMLFCLAALSERASIILLQSQTAINTQSTA